MREALSASRDRTGPISAASTHLRWSAVWRNITTLDFCSKLIQLSGLRLWLRATAKGFLQSFAPSNRRGINRQPRLDLLTRLADGWLCAAEGVFASDYL